MNFPYKLACFAAAAFGSSSAEAKYPINDWMCKVLSSSFDAKSAFSSFPLEKLPEPVETKKTKTDADDGKTTTWVELRSEGEHFEVEYKFAYRHDDASSPYGFSLQVSPAGYSPDFPKESAKWLKEMGKPRTQTGDDKVFAGPPLYEGGDQVFYFSSWRISGMYGAHWFHGGDIIHAASLCKKR